MLITLKAHSRAAHLLKKLVSLVIKNKFRPQNTQTKLQHITKLLAHLEKLH